MRVILSIFILIFGFSFSVIGQNLNSACPSIKVIAPQSITDPGGSMIFFIVVENTGKEKTFKYDWNVSAGTIIEGQNTSTIKVVVTPDLAGASVTAKVKIAGLPNECSSEAFESASVAEMPPCGLPFANYGKISRFDEIAQLNNLAVQLTQNPDFRAYFIISKQESESSDEIKTHIRKMIKVLRKFNVSKERLTFAIEPSDFQSTSIYVFQNKARPPSCDECEVVIGTDVK